MGELRRNRRLSLAQAARLTGVSKTVLGNWERGTNAPSAEQLARAASAYGVSVHWLVMGRGPRSARAVEATIDADSGVEALEQQLLAMAEKTPYAVWERCAVRAMERDLKVYRAAESALKILEGAGADEEQVEGARLLLEVCRVQYGVDLTDANTLERVRLMHEIHESGGVGYEVARIVDPAIFRGKKPGTPKAKRADQSRRKA